MGLDHFKVKISKAPIGTQLIIILKLLKFLKIKIGVMVNAFELISHPLGIKSTEILFTNKKNSRVDFVRLACHFNEFSKHLK